MSEEVVLIRTVLPILFIGALLGAFVYWRISKRLRK